MPARTPDRTEQPIAVAVFQNRFDNHPTQRYVTWAVLASALTRHKSRAEKDGPLWSPALYLHDSTRANANVDAVTCLSIDYDHTTPPWGRFASYEYAASTTHSHTTRDPHWRVVLPLNEPVEGANWPSVWRRAQRLFGGTSNEAADPQCKDAARMYYLPSAPPACTPDTRRGKGDWIAVDALPALPLNRRQTPSGRPGGCPTQGMVGRSYGTRYVQAAVESELLRLSSAAEGARNAQLNRAAFALGRFVPAGNLDAEQLTDVLSEVAEGMGLSAREAASTIRSGLNAGIALAVVS